MSNISGIQSQSSIDPFGNLQRRQRLAQSMNEFKQTQHIDGLNYQPLAPGQFTPNTTWMDAAIPKDDITDLSVDLGQYSLKNTRVYEAISYTKNQFEPGTDLENNADAKKIFYDRLAYNQNKTNFSDVNYFNIVV